MGIVAAFDKTLFSNPASKYCVLRLKTADIMIPQDARSPYHYRDHLIRFTAVGYGLPQTDTIKVELEGEWVNGKYGPQLQVKSWSEVIPPTIEGIRAYLGSGLLKGIGPATANLIVGRFGTDSLEIIEHHPERLLDIRGITEEKLTEIKNGYAESKILRDLMTVLAPFKITPATAMKIYQHFGPNGVALVRKSPYSLCQMPGFGFKRVDGIVQKSGGNPADPMRIRGAAYYAIEQARNEKGHLFVDAEKLVQDSLTLLNEKIPDPKQWVTAVQVQQELRTMITTDVVVANQGKIYLPHVYTQESETAALAVRLAMVQTEPVNLAPVMEQVKAKIGIKLSPKQAEGVEMVFHSNLSIITGGPGTGKSTILRAVVEAFQLLYPNGTIALAAPTGKASRRMAETTGIADAQTLHSLLGLRGDDTGWQKKGELEADLLIVDECSMMDMFLTHQLFKRLNPHTKVLLVGDADQLESVGAGSVFRELIASGLIPVTVLDRIFRQAKDSLVAYNAKFINEGRGDLYYGDDFSFVLADTQEEAAETVRNLYQQEVERVGVEQVQILSAFRQNGDASANSLNAALHEVINPAAYDKMEVAFGGMVLRVGDRVMQTKNDYSAEVHDKDHKQIGTGVFNGDVGVISSVGSGMVTVNFDGRYIDYPLENINELNFAYATTIHKSQGSEYQTVIIPMLAAHKILLSRNLLYTAVTRAKKRVLLVGQKKALYMAIQKSGVGKRNTILAERMRNYHRAMMNFNAHTNERNHLKIAS